MADHSNAQAPPSRGSASAGELVRYLDSYLRTSEIPDDSRALNGLQVENSGLVHRIVAAVDASLGAIRKAIKAGGDFLLVHHGLFWSAPEPIAGPHGRKVRELLSADVAVYSAHIPLDCHPEVGNNAELARKLEIQNLVPFGDYHGIQIGLAGDLRVTRAELLLKLRKELGATPRIVPAGPDPIHRIGIITGAGTSELRAAAAAGLDTFLTGEGPHHTFLEAEELGLNLVYAGHYATETLGVRALAEHLGRRFDLPWEFVDHPTGM